MRSVALLAIGVLAGCGPTKVSGAGIEVSVEAATEVVANCVEVVALSAEGVVLDSARFPRGGKTLFKVAVFPGGELEASQVLVEARGFTGADCDVLSARSGRHSVMFVPGVTRVRLTLAPPFGADGGSDAGASDAGGSDAGDVDAGDADAGDVDAGGVDAGPDAGGLDAGAGDAGLDAGMSDAGPPDDGGCAPPKDAGRPCGVGGVCALNQGCALDFPYPPSNFDPRTVAAKISGAADLDCDTTFNSTALTFTANFCNQPIPVPTVVTQDGGIEVVVLAMAGLRVRPPRTLTLVGARPVVFAIFGTASIQGTVLAEAGADQADCAGSHGSPGIADNAGSGGAGAGFGGFGGDGGAGVQRGGTGGAPHGNSLLVPLTGGCSGASGGAGGSAGGAGGVGGGAVQFSVADTLFVDGRVGARGGGGRRGLSNQSGGAGGGGAGSGGAVFLEAQTLRVLGALVTANGGGGGEGGGTSNNGIDGFSGSLNTAVPARGGDANPPNFPGFGGTGGAGTTAAANGRDQNDAAGGGGAGGGAVGRIRFNALVSCQVDGGVLSPPPDRTGCP